MPDDSQEGSLVSKNPSRAVLVLDGAREEFCALCFQLPSSVAMTHHRAQEEAPGPFFFLEGTEMVRLV